MVAIRPTPPPHRVDPTARRFGGFVVLHPWQAHELRSALFFFLPLKLLGALQLYIQGRHSEQRPIKIACLRVN